MAKNFFSGLFKGKQDKPDNADDATQPPDALPDEAAGKVTEQRKPAASPDTKEVAPGNEGSLLRADQGPHPEQDRQPDPGPRQNDGTGEPSGGADLSPPHASPQTSPGDIQPTQQAAAPQDQAPAPDDQSEKKGWFARLKSGLSKTSSKLSDDVASVFTKKKLDDDTIEDLQDVLIAADLGVNVAAKVTTALAENRFDKEVSANDIRTALASSIADTMASVEVPFAIDGQKKPFVVLMVGVNGAGKTTTIGKLAAKLKREGRSVVLAAGDTFRAAAIEQLQAWGDRAGAPVVSREEGADAAGLAFDALQQAQDRNADVLFVDTAGRLQNRRELMDELAKIVRVLKKIDPTAPHATLLTLDATVGQNAISQTQSFKEIADVSGIVMTKLDGTARGGVLVAIAEKFGVPIHFVGVGEGVDDLQPFNAKQFAEALAGVDGVS
ncbi:MAG: signal recognition particle-docking protein FtsY [Pseudomonadota bacterium]